VVKKDKKRAKLSKKFKKSNFYNKKEQAKCLLLNSYNIEEIPKTEYSTSSRRRFIITCSRLLFYYNTIRESRKILIILANFSGKDNG